MAEVSSTAADAYAPSRPVVERVLVIGCGFAGNHAARGISRALGHRADVTVVSDTDGMRYQPLLTEVAVGALDPRTIMVSLTTLKRVHLVRGYATEVDLAQQRVVVLDPAGHARQLRFDGLVLAAGGVTRMFDVPGLAEHAVGFKTVAQALYLRDVLLLRLEQANDAEAEERAAMLSFIVVGAGYAGTELIAQLARMSYRLLRRFPGARESDLRWILLDAAPSFMPELGSELGLKALAVLEALRVDVRLKTSVTAITERSTCLTDGTEVEEALVVWCAGVAPHPLIRVFSLTSARSTLIGIGMFGSITVLPLYLQIVKGASPTRSGLLTLPLVAGIMVGSLTAGQIMSRTGRYRVFPILGSATMIVALLQLWRLSAVSSLVYVGTSMAVLGAGVGLNMQTLTLRYAERRVPARHRGGHRLVHVLPADRRYDRGCRVSVHPLLGAASAAGGRLRLRGRGAAVPAGSPRRPRRRPTAAQSERHQQHLCPHPTARPADTTMEEPLHRLNRRRFPHRRLRPPGRVGAVARHARDPPARGRTRSGPDAAARAVPARRAHLPYRSRGHRPGRVPAPGLCDVDRRVPGASDDAAVRSGRSGQTRGRLAEVAAHRSPRENRRRNRTVQLRDKEAP